MESVQAGEQSGTVQPVEEKVLEGICYSKARGVLLMIDRKSHRVLSYMPRLTDTQKSGLQTAVTSVLVDGGRGALAVDALISLIFAFVLKNGTILPLPSSRPSPLPRHFGLIWFADARWEQMK